MRKTILLTILAVMTGVITDGKLLAEAAELRPFVLPSTQREQPYQQRQQSLPVPSVYQRFEEDVEEMTQGKRNQLKNQYQNLLDRSNSETEKEYYFELLRILNRY